MTYNRLKISLSLVLIRKHANLSYVDYCLQESKCHDCGAVISDIFC